MASGRQLQSAIFLGKYENLKISLFVYGTRNLGGVYMTPGRVSLRSEFTPVPSHGSIFVYMIPPQNVMPARVTPA